MEQTAAQKREATMRAKYGENWQQVIGQKAKESREAKHGKEQYSEAGKKGGSVKRPATRSYSKDRGLAVKAAKKGAAKRWGKKDL